MPKKFGVLDESGFSQEHKYFTVGERITVEQLTELSSYENI